MSRGVTNSDGYALAVIESRHLTYVLRASGQGFLGMSPQLRKVKVRELTFLGCASKLQDECLRFLAKHPGILRHIKKRRKVKK